MSGQQGKLDQSLDAIMADSKPARGNRRNARRTAKSTTVAPVGGVTKTAKAPRGPKGAAKPAPATVPATGESKIIVSNLPEDVNESQIKDYFSKTVGSVKRVLLTYGPNGRSRGVATITFAKPGSGAEAAQQLNGVKVDTRAMKIEVVLGAQNVSTPAPPKSLSDRIAKPKNAAKENKKATPATNAAKAAPATNGATKTTGRKGKKSGRAGRPKPKTSDELDAEMQDYFGGGETNGAVNGAAAAAPAAAAPVANGGDTGMVDEIS